ncbi:hypothetical protein FRC17_002868 [Serendipita sp. 399]|nr:hypothetical protein FRC17_002868 [Serendipita sp. 399]
MMQSPHSGTGQQGEPQFASNNALGLFGPRTTPLPPVFGGQQADVWRVYNRISTPIDANFIRSWERGLNGIMVFAALFAGVVSTLLIDSKQLLHPEPEDATHNLLYFLAKQTTNHTDTLPKDLDPAVAADSFKPPTWAVIVNACLLTSLTFSVLAALGAIVCLEWVLEYNEPPESAPSIEDQALRRHFRFKAMKTWYMDSLIATLPLMLYWVVLIFFCGLAIWVWHTYLYLAILPILGIAFTLGGSLFTNLAAVMSPGAPFQTVTTKGILKMVVSTHVSTLYIMEMAPLFFERWWNYMSPLLQEARPSSENEEEQQSHKSKSRMEKIQEWKEKVQEKYPWVFKEGSFQVEVDADRREDYAIRTSNTLRLSALAWLANLIDPIHPSAPSFAGILYEMNHLNEDMQLWGSSDFEAPWGAIFKIVVRYYHDPASKSHTRIDFWRTVVAQLQAKMINNTQVFSGTVESILDLDDLHQFLLQLRANIGGKTPPTCDKVLEGIFTLLSRSELDLKEHDICFEILDFVLEYLEDHKEICDLHLSVAWVFALCATDPSQRKALLSGNVFDEGFSFKSIKCGNIAIGGYIGLMDGCLQNPGTSNSEEYQLYLHHQSTAVALLVDFLIPEYGRHHDHNALDGIPAPKDWAFQLIHTEITRKSSGAPALLEDKVVQEICRKMKEAAIVATKVIQIVAPRVALSQWTDIFTAMAKLSPSDLKKIYKPILFAFTSETSTSHEKTWGFIRQVVQKVTGRGSSSDRRGTSNTDVLRVSSNPRTRRTEPYGHSVPTEASSQESKFFSSLACILTKVVECDRDSISDCTNVIQLVAAASWEGWTLNQTDIDSIDALKKIINKRIQLQPGLSLSFRITLNSLNQLRETYRPRAATAGLAPNSIGRNNGVAGPSDEARPQPFRLLGDTYIMTASPQIFTMSLPGEETHDRTSIASRSHSLELDIRRTSVVLDI